MQNRLQDAKPLTGCKTAYRMQNRLQDAKPLTGCKKTLDILPLNESECTENFPADRLSPSEGYPAYRSSIVQLYQEAF
jgi:hypothetical protein